MTSEYIKTDVCYKLKGHVRASKLLRIYVERVQGLADK